MLEDHDPAAMLSKATGELEKADRFYLPSTDSRLNEQAAYSRVCAIALIGLLRDAVEQRLGQRGG